MKGLQFERDTAIRLKELGWSVETTPQSNDYGADLICFVGDEKLVVQCKDYTTKSVGIKAVQEVLGARSHYRGSIGALIFNGKVTNPAYKLAKSNEIIVLSIKELEVGCTLDRLKEQAEIEEAKKRKAERRRIIEEERERERRRSRTKRIIIYEFEKQFIDNYILENRDHWKREWMSKHNHESSQDKSNSKNHSSRLFGIALAISKLLTQKPATRSSSAVDYESYESHMLKLNEQQILKEAINWAEQKYAEIGEKYIETTNFGKVDLSAPTNLQIYFDGLTKKGAANQSDARARAISKAYNDGASIAQIARRYHITPKRVHKILQSGYRQNS